MRDEVFVAIAIAGFAILAASMTTLAIPGRASFETAACASSTPGGIVRLLNCPRSSPAKPEAPAPVAIAQVSQR